MIEFASGSIVSAILSMTGRLTMLNIARWNNKYSYKTIDRFFTKKINWVKMNYQISKAFFGKELILAGDEVIITKSGKHTFGLGDVANIFPYISVFTL